MKITIIGCWHAFPKAGEATSGYLLEHEGFRVLLDCGSGVVSLLQTFVALEDIDAVLLSHYHHDHVTDIGVLQYARLLSGISGRATKPLLIYGHDEDEVQFNRLAYPPHVQSILYKENDTLQIGPFTISFFRTNHPVPCFAMKIKQGSKTFVYTADTGYLEELATFAFECDLLLAESSTYEGQDLSAYGHMMSKEAGILADKSNTRNLVLTHLPHFGDLKQLIEEAKKYYDGPIQLAALGKQMEL